MFFFLYRKYSIACNNLKIVNRLVKRSDTRPFSAEPNVVAPLVRCDFELCLKAQEIFDLARICILLAVFPNESNDSWNQLF